MERSSCESVRAVWRVCECACGSSLAETFRVFVSAESATRFDLRGANCGLTRFILVSPLARAKTRFLAALSAKPQQKIFTMSARKNLSMNVNDSDSDWEYGSPPASDDSYEEEPLETTDEDDIFEQPKEVIRKTKKTTNEVAAQFEDDEDEDDEEDELEDDEVDEVL